MALDEAHDGINNPWFLDSEKSWFYIKIKNIGTMTSEDIWNMIEILSNDIKSKIDECFNNSKESINIISPFVSNKTAELLCNIVTQKNLECVFITRCYMRDFLQKINSIDALDKMIAAGIKVYALDGLHAKLYLFDDSAVVIGSANFTMGGLENNVELSILTDDEDIISSCSEFADGLEAYCIENNGSVTEDLIENMRKAYLDADRKHQTDCGNESLATFGARPFMKAFLKDWKKKDFEICDDDPVFELMFSEAKPANDYNHNAWIKIEGDSTNRFSWNGKHEITKVEIDGQEAIVINFSKRPSGIQSGDYIYIVAMINDESGKPSNRIVGRGIAKVRQNQKEVPIEWINDFGYTWMKKYKYYIELTDVELINLNREDCIPLTDVYDALGKRTYASTISKEYVGNMSLTQCRRSHLKLTLDAKSFIDDAINGLASKYGFQTSIGVRTR